MEFNRTDLSNVQELLVGLVRALAPLVEGDSTFKREAEKLASHIFVPREASSSLPDYKIQLLTTLKTAQKQMEKWIQEPKKNGSIQEKAIPESSTSVLSQAKNLITQVRHAIQLLSSSSNLRKSKPDDFHDALAPVKKWVDSLVEAVSRKEMPSSDHRKPSFPFRPLPLSPREDLLKKVVPVPSFEEKGEKSLPKKTFRPLEKEETPLFFHRSRAKGKEEKREALFSTESLSLPKDVKPKEPLVPLPESEKPLILSQERISLPGAPYTPPKPLLLKVKKKKKKRKGLWPEKDEESPLDKA